MLKIGDRATPTRSVDQGLFLSRFPEGAQQRFPVSPQGDGQSAGAWDW